MACFTYNPSPSIKLQGVYNSENWLPPLTSPTPARRRPSTIADMMVGIEAGGYSYWCYQLSAITLPATPLCTWSGAGSARFTQHLFFLSAARGFGQAGSRNQPGGHRGSAGRGNFSHIESWSCVVFLVLSRNTNRYLLS